MSEAETKRKFDEIVDFADIGKFMDTPVSHYSSGMYARLGFSIAIHVDADIFLADEVLAVGDRPFKKKCMAKMQEIRRQGTTIFYVSHATASVRNMCDRVLVMRGDRFISEHVGDDINEHSLVASAMGIAATDTAKGTP